MRDGGWERCLNSWIAPRPTSQDRSRDLNRRNIPSIGILLAGCQGAVLVENFHRLINLLYLARVPELLSTPCWTIAETLSYHAKCPKPGLSLLRPSMFLFVEGKGCDVTVQDCT